MIIFTHLNKVLALNNITAPLLAAASNKKKFGQGTWRCLNVINDGKRDTQYAQWTLDEIEKTFKEAFTG